MIFRNILTITRNNYESLVSEIRVRPSIKKPLVIFIFGGLPAVIGALLGWISPVSGNIVIGLVSVISVMTGFSINAIVLLIGNSGENSYDLEVHIVDQTIDFTLYAIVVGIFTLLLILLGYIFISSNLQLGIGGVKIFSVITYTMVIHYFLGLFVVSHRLFTFVKGVVNRS